MNVTPFDSKRVYAFHLYDSGLIYAGLNFTARDPDFMFFNRYEDRAHYVIGKD